MSLFFEDELAEEVIAGSAPAESKDRAVFERKNKNSGHIVVQSNDVMSKLRNSTSAAESKVLYYIASKLPKRIDDSTQQMPVIVLDLRELCCAAEWDPTSRQRIKDMRSLLWSLKDGRNATFTIRTESGWDMPLPWIEQITFGYRAPKVGLLLNRKLAPFYLRLTSNFTCLDVAMTAKLSSKRSLSLYEFLKANQYRGEAVLDVEKFKAQNDIAGNSYNTFSQLQRRVLNPAVTEINMHTDVTVAYEKSNAGRKTELLRFSIESKDPEATEEYIAEWAAQIKQYMMTPEQEQAEKEKVEQLFFGTAAPAGDEWEYGLNTEH